jgi:hypothetical protein
MTDSEKFFGFDPPLHEHESPLRRMMAQSGTTAYQPLHALSEAQSWDDGIVVLEGDDGGQVYLVARARDVRCTEDALDELLVSIDSTQWDGDDTSRRVYSERQRANSGIPGGMGGGRVVPGIWLHPALFGEGLADLVLEVLAGQRQRLGNAVRTDWYVGLVCSDGERVEAVHGALWHLVDPDGGADRWGGYLSLPHPDPTNAAALSGISVGRGATLEFPTGKTACTIGGIWSSHRIVHIQGCESAPF